MVAKAELNTCFRGCCSSDAIPLHLPSSSYSLIQPIARGSESIIYEARLHGQRVVAKKPVLSTSEDIDKFHRELQLLCKLNHLGLVNLVAAHARPPIYLFFFEYYEMGSLAHMLHVEEWSPSVEEALLIAYDLAKALHYVHEHGILHRDVKPGNILLDRDHRPRLADFGLATYKKDLQQISVENWRSSGKPTGGFHKKNMVGTLIYMAPEILRKNVHTEKSDVYSFSVSINELLTGVVPYTDLRAEAEAHTVLEMNYTEQKLTAAVVTEGLRPVLPRSGSDVPEELLALIQRCWHSNPSCRPSFEQIIIELDGLKEHILQAKHAEGSLAVLPSSLNSQCQNGVNAFPISKELNWFKQGEISSKLVLSGSTNAGLWPCSLPKAVQYCPTLSWGSFATCGRRETMEDTHFLLPKISNDKDIHMFGIFDGHRGVAAAEFSSRALPGFLRTAGESCSPADALTEAFIKTDITFREELASNCTSKRIAQKNYHPGCTALIALIVRNMLFVANAGDCRAILCRAGHPFPMSKEHLACCHEERIRVMEAGMEVKWMVDTWRVGPPALQVTRSIGDDDLKPAVTAEPEIIETTLSADDEFLVMASDGLWDVVSNEAVISTIKSTVKEPGMCSKRLASKAIEQGSNDNITVIVVFVRPVSTFERVY